MAQIEVKYDPSLQLEPIVDIMYSTSEDPDAHISEIEQTKVTGIVAPLIRINDITINWSQVKSFDLYCDSLLPRLTMTIDDTLGLTKTLDHPKTDNIVRVEVLPQFENAYKKIDLRFYIVHFSNEGDLLFLNCAYNVKELYKNRLESYGEITFYELCDKIAKECELGLASNISNTEDKRYFYCKNQSYIDLLNKELKCSGTQTIIPDLWIDWHNYLNIVDIWERYQSTDEVYKVWSAPNRQIDVESGTEVKPVEIDAIVSNAPGLMQSQLYINNYRIINNSSDNMFIGTDKIVEVYHYDKNESESKLIQDGDVRNDLFIKNVYMGEAFGGSTFQLQRVCRDCVMQKINNQCISISLENPFMAFERGCKLDLRWYDMNEFTRQAKEKNDISTTAEVPEEEPNQQEIMSLNKQITGQYLILETHLNFECIGEKRKWRYDLLLGRPADQVKSYGQDNG